MPKPTIIGGFRDLVLVRCKTMRRAIYLLVAFLALLSTAAIMGIFIVLTLRIPGESSCRTLSQVSIALEAIVLVFLSWCISAHGSVLIRQWSIKNLQVYCGIYVLAIISATIAAVASLTQFSKSACTEDEKLFNPSTDDLVVIVSLCVALCIGFALQTGFLCVHLSLLVLKGDHHSPPFHGKSCIKSLRYSHTAPGVAPIPTTNPTGSRIPYPSINGRPKSGTVTPKVQLADAICSVMSKKPVATNEAQQPSSAGAILHRSSEDAFGTRDTSFAEALNCQVRSGAIPPSPPAQGQCLDNITEGPTGINTPSSNNYRTPSGPAKIQAPSSCHIPVPSRRNQLSPRSSMKEPDIHPLLRSNS
ncbi:hypothetical protein CEP52_017216 [Fusarium oligoseptatum]|uniref:Uncharacterized protein n=1 Tax=Fusarium oligoseptatum TaxID=2604345 RepID=A0A428RUY0_9HYPO|nr:hypothetical protein CEP52_017216 [Fusarium oligoseptatum]